MQVVSVVSGIFFKTKIEAVAKRFGEHQFCNTIQEIATKKPDVIIVDLEHPKAAEVLQVYGKSVVAFGPHLRTDLMGIANKFGAQAYPRSTFFNDLDKILHRYE
jgi:hypothetical protein